MVMKIGILKEQKSGENRVAIVPSTISALSKKGYEFFVESDAGLLSNYSNEDYTSAGAKIVEKPEIFSCELICKINSPSDEEILNLNSGAVFPNFLSSFSISCQSKDVFISFITVYLWRYISQKNRATKAALFELRNLSD